MNKALNSLMALAYAIHTNHKFYSSKVTANIEEGKSFFIQGNVHLQLNPEQIKIYNCIDKFADQEPDSLEITVEGLVRFTRLFLCQTLAEVVNKINKFNNERTI